MLASVLRSPRAISREHRNRAGFRPDARDGRRARDFGSAESMSSKASTIGSSRSYSTRFGGCSSPITEASPKDRIQAVGERLDSPVAAALLHTPPLVRRELRGSAGAAVGPPALRAQGGGERAVAGAALPAPGRVGRQAGAAGARGDQPRRPGRRAAGAARVDAAHRHAQPLRARAAGGGARPRAGAAVRRAAGGGVHRGALARAARAAGARLRARGRRRAGRFLRDAGRPPRSATPRSSSSWRARCCRPPTATRASRSWRGARRRSSRRCPTAAGSTRGRPLTANPLPAVAGRGTRRSRRGRRPRRRRSSR